MDAPEYPMTDAQNTRIELATRLEPFAKGCFSGNIAEWPQLKPLLRDIFIFLTQKK